jgi:hypothetical protein
MYGRTRHLLVETWGRFLPVVVTAPSVQDRDGAMLLLARLRHPFSRVRVIRADRA